jgi:hypothetical protein
MLALAPVAGRSTASSREKGDEPRVGGRRGEEIGSSLRCRLGPRPGTAEVAAQLRGSASTRRWRDPSSSAQLVRAGSSSPRQIHRGTRCRKNMRKTALSLCRSTGIGSDNPTFVERLAGSLDGCVASNRRIFKSQLAISVHAKKNLPLVCFS